MSSLIGRTLSHYQIVDEISRGGMGVARFLEFWGDGDLDRDRVTSARTALDRAT